MTDFLQPTFPYSPCSELGCITAYFNPVHYRTRRVNYEAFAAPLRKAGIPLLTVECAFGDDPFELPPGADVLQVRAPDILWQKERLINLGASHLPPEVSKVAWLDGDILFTNPDWAVQTARLLDEFAIVQPFVDVIRLDQGERSAAANSPRQESFASVWERDRSLISSGSYDSHGHTGFAWAARRELLANHGLYEAFVTSNGDHYLAHAFAGDFTSRCMLNVRQGSRLVSLSRNPRRSSWFAFFRALVPPALRRELYHIPGVRQPNQAFWKHFLAWAAPTAGWVGGRIGCTPGTLLHLWHGDMVNRQAGVGRQLMHAQGFDPGRDIRIGPSGCIEWASDMPQLHSWLPQFFRRRREDGE